MFEVLEFFMYIIFSMIVALTFVSWFFHDVYVYFLNIFDNFIFSTVSKMENLLQNKSDQK